MPGEPRFDISFVIPVRNDAARLSRCLESIRSNAYPQDQVEIIVVDNGSTDESPGIAAAAGARVFAAPQGRVAGMRNQGAASAAAPILAFVDADHVLGSQWIQIAIENLTRDLSIGAIGALYLAPVDGTWVQRAYGRLRGRSRGRRDVEWLAAGNMAIARGAFKDVGGFDATLETCEDVELCKKLRSAGLRVVSDDRLVNVHLGDPSTLRALFGGELWRGRSNLAVSFRPPVRLTELPSALIPIIQLVALIALTSAPLLGGRAWAMGCCVRDCSIRLARDPNVDRQRRAESSRSRRQCPGCRGLRRRACAGADRVCRSRRAAPQPLGMRTVSRPIRVLELRSVQGTGGGPEKTILHGAALSDARKYAVTVCYIRDQRDTVFGIEKRAAELGVDYVEVRERHSFDFSIWAVLRRLVTDRGIDIVHSHDYKTDLYAWLLGRRTGVVPLATSHGYTGNSSTRGSLLCRGQAAGPQVPAPDRAYRRTCGASSSERAQSCPGCSNP